MDREADVQKIEDVHTRFDYFKDKKRMENKIKDPRFDLTGELPDTEDEALTTDFEIEADADDPIDATLYKRYKMIQSRLKRDADDIQKDLDSYTEQMKAEVNGD